MNTDWKNSGAAFLELLDKIEAVRHTLNCNHSSAWFRGETAFGRDLNPTLMRIKGDLDSDRKKEIKLLGDEETLLKRDWKKNESTIQKLKDEMHEFYTINHTQEKEKGKLYKQLQSGQLERLKKKEIINHKIKCINAIQRGEEESFIDWCRRIEHNYYSSWEALAEMQHFGVPTRLLDWTENLAVALFFALKKYRDELEKYWANNRTKTGLSFYKPVDLKNPCLWVLNPYKLSRVATGKNNIIDPTLSKELDYYEAWFVHKNWKYDKAIPIYSPWKNPRIYSQQGIFTVQGLDKQPLNKQLSVNNDILACIEIPPNAAIFAVKHLQTFFGLDDFYLLRDPDNLGKKVKERFIVPRNNK